MRASIARLSVRANALADGIGRLTGIVAGATCHTRLVGLPDDRSGGDVDELDRVLEQALAVATSYVRRPRSERLLGRVLSASDVLASRGYAIPPRALPAHVLEAA